MSDLIPNHSLERFHRIIRIMRIDYLHWRIDKERRLHGCQRKFNRDVRPVRNYKIPLINGFIGRKIRFKFKGAIANFSLYLARNASIFCGTRRIYCGCGRTMTRYPQPKIWDKSSSMHESMRLSGWWDGAMRICGTLFSFNSIFATASGQIFHNAVAGIDQHVFFGSPRIFSEYRISSI